MEINKKILASAFIIGLLALSLGWGTYSYFSDTEKSTGNVFTAGTIDIRVTGDGYTWSAGAKLEDMKPSETGWIKFDITNVGTNPVDIYKHLTVTGLSGGITSEPEWNEGLCRLGSTEPTFEAKWSNDAYYTGSHSAKLTVYKSAMGYSKGVFVGFPTDFLTLDQIPPMSFMVYAPSDSDIMWADKDNHIAQSPYLVLVVDLGEETDHGRYVSMHPTDGWSPRMIIAETGTWTTATPACDTWIGWFWDGTELGEYLFTEHTLMSLTEWHQALLAQGYTHYYVRGINIQHGFGDPDWMDAEHATVYVDDLVMNGVPYDLEPDLYVEKCHIDRVITYDLSVTIRESTNVIISPEDNVKVSDINCYWIYLGTLEPDETMTVTQSYHMQPEVTNWAQGDKMTFDIEIYATQIGAPPPE